VNPHNVLCGERGVARVFGPQKGATPEQVELLSAAMERWAKVLEREVHLDLRTSPGSGASGGLDAGLAVLGAQLLPRFEVMFDHVDLESAIGGADLVLTAEGAIDEQTPCGKIPAEVARRAKRHGKPVIALAGTVGTNAQINYYRYRSMARSALTTNPGKSRHTLHYSVMPTTTARAADSQQIPEHQRWARQHQPVGGMGKRDFYDTERVLRSAQPSTIWTSRGPGPV
jgi:hypothetical protein